MLAPPQIAANRRNSLKLTVDHAESDIDMLGSVDSGHQRNVFGTQPLHSHNARTMPAGACEVQLDSDAVLRPFRQDYD